MIRTSKKDIGTLFQQLGVRAGETVMLHSALFSLGMIEEGVAGLYDELTDMLGPDGTLVVPTFTYSFRRNEVFDVSQTPSAKNIGVFSEFVRTRPEAVRCPDPIFSMAAVGARSAALMERTATNCFGPGSTFGRLFDENILFIAIGITYCSGLTGFLHIEKLADVPYRYDLHLTGTTRLVGGEEISDAAVHYAQLEEVNGMTITNREPMGKAMEAAGVSKAVEYGHGRHVALRGQDWCDFVLGKLADAPFAMLDLNSTPTRPVIPQQ